MNESYLTTLLRLRLLVGFLGERAQFAWWPTALFDASSRHFLEPVFSKTAQLAQYHGVVEAARRLHDEHLSVGSYHLFRFSEEVEQDLHTLIQASEGKLIVAQSSQAKEAALEALKGIGEPTTTAGIGPIAVGSIGELGSSRTLKAIAGAYWAAFSRDSKCYPYLKG